MYCMRKEERLCVWWDPIKEFTDGCRYKLSINGSVCYTDQNYYDFDNLDGGTTYKFTLEVVDKDGKTISAVDRDSFSTLKLKTKIDVSKEPFCIVGDGVTDNTEKILQAFDACDENHYLFFPLGEYICNKLVLKKGAKFVMASGAVFKSKGDK